jgi:hypothetical protein
VADGRTHPSEAEARRWVWAPSQARRLRSFRSCREREAELGRGIYEGGLGFLGCVPFYLRLAGPVTLARGRVAVTPLRWPSAGSPGHFLPLAGRVGYARWGAGDRSGPSIWPRLVDRRRRGTWVWWGAPRTARSIPGRSIRGIPCGAIHRTAGTSNGGVEMLTWRALVGRPGREGKK